MASGAGPGGGDAGWTQAVPWVLSLASLAWNYWNYCRTTGLQKRIRFDTVRLDEFKRIRATIDAVLADLGSERDTLRSLSASGADRAALRSQVEERQKKILDNYLRLESALLRADASEYAQGQDWLGTIEGHWEAFLTAIDKAYGPHRRDDEVRAVPAEAAGKLSQLILAVEARAEREMRRFTDDA